MTELQRNSDMIMATLWVTVYFLSMVSTCKSKYPAIAPLASAFIVPWEIIVAVRNVINEEPGNYIIYTQTGWALIHFFIVCVVLFKLHYYEKKKMVAYILFSIFVGGLLLVIFTTRSGQMYTSYINTWIGILIWLHFVATKKDYPLTMLNLAVAICKCAADIFGFIVYWRYDTIIFVVSLLLPVTDAIHIIVLIRAMHQRKKENRRKKYIM